MASSSSLHNNNSGCYFLSGLPVDIHVHILTYLRAYDLSAVQMTCTFFHDDDLIQRIVKHFATQVYPPELTDGYRYDNDPRIPDDSETTKMSFQHLRNMEMLVVARVLTQPGPEPVSGFYVSKSWCKTALRWLELQQEGLRPHKYNCHSRLTKKKLSKKQLRLRNRHLSDVQPPWPNANADICCIHSNLKEETNSKSARARRKVLDKQAWKVLKRLYPDSTALDSILGECVQCAFEQETVKKFEQNKVEQIKVERKKPLKCPLVRGIYTRSRGVPLHCLAAPAAVGTRTGSATKPGCPLLPGLYHALPRHWLHRWRRYLKHGEEGLHPTIAPDATALLCHAHRLPLIPPHLEAYLYGETSHLLSTITVPGFSPSIRTASASVASFSLSNATGTMHPDGLPPLQSPGRMRSSASTANAVAVATVNSNLMDQDMLQSLRAIGMSPTEVASQRMAMMTLERRPIYSANDSNTPAAAHINNVNNDSTIHQLSDISNMNNEQQQQPGELSAYASNKTNEQLDRENGVVVEILTEEEYDALTKWWPKIHSSFVFRFAVLPQESSFSTSPTTNIISGNTNNHSNNANNSTTAWSTPPCRECDATGRGDCFDNLTVRNRIRAKSNNNNKGSNHYSAKKAPASTLEY